jgi:hypothetical protein
MRQACQATDGLGARQALFELMRAGRCCRDPRLRLMIEAWFMHRLPSALYARPRARETQTTAMMRCSNSSRPDGGSGWRRMGCRDAGRS